MNGRRAVYGDKEDASTNLVDLVETLQVKMRNSGLGTALTLNRSTLSEAMAPSGARPGRVFADVGGKYGTDARASEEGACIFFRARRRKNEV